MRKEILVCTLLLAPYSFAGDCEQHEALIATCHLSGKDQRVASYCANMRDGTVKYKFIRNGMPELNVDFTPKNKLKRWLDIGTYTTYLGFNRGVYSYVLIVPEEKPGAVASLHIKKYGETISTLSCDENSFGDENIKIGSIEDVSDDIVRDNGFKFP